MAKLLGYRKKDLTSKKTGKEYTAVNLYFGFESKDVTGQQVFSEFITGEKLGSTVLEVGSEYDLNYGKDWEGKAYLQSIEKVG